jgi:transporter family-2 protein
MNPAALLTALAALVGVLLAIQSPTNALLGRAAGSSLTGALISFLIGAAALVAVVVATGNARLSPDLRTLPWYGWLGGLYGAAFVAAAAYLAPRIGAGALLTAAIAGQIVAGLLLDHYGLIGMPRHPITWPRGLGAALVLAGAVLVRRG